MRSRTPQFHTILIQRFYFTSCSNSIYEQFSVQVDSTFFPPALIQHLFVKCTFCSINYDVRYKDHWQSLSESINRMYIPFRWIHFFDLFYGMGCINLYCNFQLHNILVESIFYHPRLMFIVLIHILLQCLWIDSKSFMFFSNVIMLGKTIYFVVIKCHGIGSC